MPVALTSGGMLPVRLMRFRDFHRNVCPAYEKHLDRSQRVWYTRLHSLFALVTGVLLPSLSMCVSTRSWSEKGSP